MTGLTDRCEACRQLAPELALGIADDDDRRRAAEHLADCPACRQLVAELTVVVDALTLAAEPVAPPAGFEEAVVARLDERSTVAGGRPRRWRTALAAAAAAVVLVAVVATGVVAVGRNRSSTWSSDLAAPSGQPVGEVVIDPDDRPWLLVTVGATAAPGEYAVVCHYEDRDWPMGSLVVHPPAGASGSLPAPSTIAGGAFGALLPFEPDEPVEVVLVPRTGGSELRATLS